MRDDLDNPGEPLYAFAQRIGMSEHLLNRLRKGRVKEIKDEYVEKIAKGIKRDAKPVREELERRARGRREDIARAA